MKKDYVASLGDAAAWPPGGVSCPDAHDGNSLLQAAGRKASRLCSFPTASTSS